MTAGRSAARLFIVCGLPGSGKTTLAKQLETRFRAVRFCPDDWMDALEFDLYDERARGRIESLQWILAKNLLALGTSAITEWGTWSKDERDQLRIEARRLGAAVELHLLDVPLDVLFARIRQRNRESPPIELHDLMKWSNSFERPSPEELDLYDVAKIVQ
jgi:predicted kinase